MEKFEKELHRKDGLIAYNPLVGNFVGWFIATIGLYLTHYINDEYGIIDGYGTILIGLFIGTLVTTRLHAFREAFRFEIQKKEPKTHFWRGLFTVILAYVIGWITHAIGDGVNLYSAISAVFAALYIGSIYYFFFDPILSMDRGKKPTYISKAKKGSWSDAIFAHFPDHIEEIVMVVIKSILLIGSTLLYIYRFNQII